ncbi:pyruvate kinase [Azospirillum halopraeferens]|uniref:pyruvate kinase n=1 Tax=Azospirillum halopraeferens TaxID=34010 RepID=UPI00040F1B95|nr:pyruvate kinase [Azospirillum halopraeferens]
MTVPTAPTTPAALLDLLRSLRADVAAEGAVRFDRWRPGLRRAARPSLLNLAHYLALRRRDLRGLQTALSPWGLSSLGRLEGRVLANLDAVIAALARLEGDQGPAFPGARAFFRGGRLLDLHTGALFGRPPAGRRGRILVTLPSEAAADPSLLARLVASGADAVRINCAHDDAAAWSAMIAHLRTAEAAAGRRLTVLMDLGGPKLRTAAVGLPEGQHRLKHGDRLFLAVQPPADAGTATRAWATLSLPEVVGQLRPGHRVFLDDGKLGGTVAETGPDGAWLAVERARLRGTRLAVDKGVNLPDTPLPLDPLTPKDLEDLDFVAAHADLIGYSFVQRPSDVERLQEELARRRPDAHRIGLIAKVETPLAVRNLPELIVHGMGRQPFGVMIARGDLAVELGFERLAEMQEELLWLCEAAHVPVIWATQVLENLVKKGLPSRGEMTDAAMAARAECVMLNKGPYLPEAVEALGRMLARMGEHQAKKTPRLRALQSWADREA